MVNNNSSIIYTLGTQGFQGVQGVQGQQGSNVNVFGVQGIQGVQGPQGDFSPQGFDGFPGIEGNEGDQGYEGLQGLQGLQGAQGPQGERGLLGNSTVVIGPQGPRGVEGGSGFIGPTGFQGVQGMQGPAARGPQGTTGAQNNGGAQGPTGFRGAGVQGPQSFFLTFPYYFTGTGGTPRTSLTSSDSAVAYNLTTQNNVIVRGSTQFIVQQRGWYNVGFTVVFALLAGRVFDYNSTFWVYASVVYPDGTTQIFGYTYFSNGYSFNNPPQSEPYSLTSVFDALLPSLSQITIYAGRTGSNGDNVFTNPPQTASYAITNRGGSVATSYISIRYIDTVLS